MKVFSESADQYNHTKMDIQWALSVGARIISGHDYCDNWPGVIQVVEEYGGAERLRGSVWVVKQKRQASRRYCTKN